MLIRSSCDRVRRLAGRAAVPAACAALSTTVAAQNGPVNGMRPADLRAHAIVDATVVIRPGEVLERATIVMRDGVIVAVGTDATVPDGAWTWSGEGLRVYPGLIEPAMLVEVPAGPESLGDHWNDRVHPQLSVAGRSVPDDGDRERLRELGFAAAAVYPKDGIFRGTGAVVALADEAGHVLAYDERAAMAVGFDYGGRFGSGTYPGSLMGAIATMRQTLADARWHAECRRIYEQNPQGNEPPLLADALVALSDAMAGRQPVLFDVTDEHAALRAARIADEFDLDLVLLGGGSEYRRLSEIAALDVPLIVPLQFPDRPDVSTLAAAERVSLRDMMSWEQAPTNAARLVDAGAELSLTTHRLRKIGDFHANLRQAVRHGLSEDDALAALTVNPARLLGLEDVLGTIELGKAANLVVVDGSLFAKKPKIRDVWVNGRRHEISSEPSVRLVATGTLVTDLGIERPVSVDTTKKRVSIDVDEETIKAKKVVVQQDRLSFTVDGRPFGSDGYVQLSGVLVDGVVVGSGALPDGRWFGFTITPGPDAPVEEDQAVAAAPERAASESPSGDGVSGLWNLDVLMEAMGETLPATLRLELEDEAISGWITAMGETMEMADGTWDGDSRRAEFRLDLPDGPSASFVASVDADRIEGSVEGGEFAASFTGSKSADQPPAGDDGGDEKDEEPVELPPSELVLPLGAYGLAEAPDRRDVLIENATIWTCGTEDILENGAMLVVDGRIEAVYREAPATVDVDRIDVGGRHVTPGLIDCHSHTGIDGGVNEWAQTNTAEVRIGDVIDPDDIGWYRQLAGGLTAANQLHGSANPIGGQNSVVKLKWTGIADDYRIDDAIEGIKFALGENVKRSQGRYPNTRMGVETFIRDAFTAAREYRDRWERHRSLPTEQRLRTMPPQRDLELETLVEILEGERLIHCHSYRQDEILMLIRLADEFGFTIGTFQHVLEGYKVADDIAAHGAGASSFSDWWAYKMEVMDAIPHNGALMTDVGVLVSFNSDSSELARRMNTEASKAVRYGGLDRHEALKLVTLNPARQLRVDHRTGSLEPGKDADFVIWSDDPLSTYARCEQTWIEGACYFDREQDLVLRRRDKEQRQRLLQKILARAHGASGEEDKSKEPSPTPVVAGRPSSRLMARVIEARRAWMEEQVRRGVDPDEIRPGRCACNSELWMMMLGNWSAEEDR
jgi:N-acetylglucosamine-6-phosphate deacetylase